MKVELTRYFIKSYKKRILPHKKLHSKYKERLMIFTKNPESPILRDHALSGDLKGYRAFSVTGDVRVVYKIKNDVAYLADIGTHNQVYGK